MVCIIQAYFLIGRIPELLKLALYYILYLKGLRINITIKFLNAKVSTLSYFWPMWEMGKLLYCVFPDLALKVILQMTYLYIHFLRIETLLPHIYIYVISINNNT